MSKAETIPNNRVEQDYRAVNGELEAIIWRERLVTLPDYPLQVRLATPSEEAASPAPQMRPPPFIGNSGQHGVFILTTGNGADGAQAFDDFNFEPPIW